MLILASSSIFRKQLLEKLHLEFKIFSPNINETRLENENPQSLVIRLSKLKATKVAQTQAGIIIASDQVAIINNDILSKPYTKENAIQQLTRCSGKRIDFLTGLCVLNTKNNQNETIIEKFSVYFKNLTKSQIKNYINIENPLNCAGSFKSEGLGIALFEKLEGDDPNALIGLPLIKLIPMLEKHNIKIL